MNGLPGNAPFEVRDASGQLVGYFVTADEMTRVKALAEENAALRRERDAARADLRSRVPVATPAEEEEMRRLVETAVPGGLANLIAELEAAGNTDGRQ